MRWQPRPLVCALLAATTLAAQEPTFDVASIRPSDDTGRSEIQPTPFGRLTTANATAKQLILRAYGLVEPQLIGAPGWLDQDGFDIEARVTPPPPGGSEALVLLLRSLLTERFALKAHFEEREQPAYALTFARHDRQLGPQVQPTRADCAGPTTLTQDDVRAQVRDGWPPCGMAFFVGFTTGVPNEVKMRVRRSGITMAALATVLQPLMARPIVDQTGLPGAFDVEYSYAPQPPTPGVESPFGPDAPSLTVAVQEQLGLKLESRRLRVPVLVITSIARPTEN
jgi:uncharacterized protein (TIGR03435 family)